ncbi:hypothetical protein NEUTE1DRAFT_44631 [Neurospora tetrasperma FGSC 2508]|uniref:Uncharacterized protein n=1 Tax=Neurospora tetrasperma (strain FGSC 2508 / ATCC MYA-4615 / P0657) TaxID=510951 RepID=F8MQ94_NEUT8|nr:uncharacterized protein NEUTE1DRAFT_44631 [Neurospora tetrasperma FGSC 2508]EGO56524.1 hypothetical protein NEUTE1DRAFT_44631 [Neurospora tetrasperma FGSC 2508]
MAIISIGLHHKNINRRAPGHQLKNSSHDFQQYDATQYYLPSQGFEAIPDHLTGGQDGCLSTHLRIISTMRTADHQAYGLKHTIPAILNAERKGSQQKKKKKEKKEQESRLMKMKRLKVYSKTYFKQHFQADGICPIPEWYTR